MTATYDPIAPIALAAIEHMNSDHADAVLAYARGLAGIAWAEMALVTRLEASGIELRVTGNGQTTTVRIPFEPPLTHADQLRPTLVQLAQRARQQLSSVTFIASPAPQRDANSAQQLLNMIATRRSFALNDIAPDPIDLANVALMLEAANWAPSHGQTEPWRFAVYSGEARQTLSDAFGAAYRLLNPDQPAGSPGEASQRNRVWQAPVWIAIGMRPNPKRPEWEELIATGCAVQNLHLMASALGLAGKWTSGACAIHPHVAEIVGFAPDTRLLGFFYTGQPASGDWPRGQRRSLDGKVVWHGGRPLPN
ncbi:nitroreductase [Chloroflexus islandicus]|uniref:Nitroreductase n=1 Tax=Chloroflexus islandicus TaxID=1707952 RepID=A0A178MFV9_9CHLR|nr:nitroreductase family protein [Chloroflexus islandicus]OAN46975.1 nitroreductase [Chloroflexus islandicus]